MNNEAAERLTADEYNAALNAERMATMERIRVALPLGLHDGCLRYHERMTKMGLPVTRLHDVSSHDAEADALFAILDAEAAR